jgi:hemoglobin
VRSVALALTLATVAACGQVRSRPPTSTAARTPESLYERLGGIDAIRALVDDFVAVVAADVRINRAFARTDITRFKIHLVDQICQLAGGPCHYRGRTMKNAHAALRVSGADLDAMLDDLRVSLTKFQVPEREQRELTRALAALAPEIVTR